MQKLNVNLRFDNDFASDTGGGGWANYGGNQSFAFGVNVTELEDLAAELQDYAVKIQNCYNEMFGLIAGMEGNTWNGEVYNAFKESGETYRSALALYSTTIALFSEKIGDTAELGQTLIDNIKECCRK